jgi:hypothetical protein
MMSWFTRLFDSHARLRDSLSAYLDGELDARTAERLETHLAGCASCREELEGLRTVSAALSDLEEADVPRSFALRPAQLEQRPAGAPSLSPLAVGSRLAAAGVAVALAAVVVIDAGNFGNEGGSVQTSAPETQTDRSMEFDAGEDASGGDGALSPEEPAAGGAGGPATGGPTTGESAPEPAPEIDENGSPSAEDDAFEQPAAAPDGAPEAADEGGGGIGTLTAIEIGLGVALAVLVAAALGLTLAPRRQRS